MADSTDGLGTDGLGVDEAQRIADRMRHLAGSIARQQAQFLRLLDQIDRSEAWTHWIGVRTLAQWVSFVCEMDSHTAREHIRVMRGLRELPQVASLLEEGRISFSKAREITRLSGRIDDAEAADITRHATASQISAMVAAYRRLDSTDPEDIAEVRVPLTPAAEAADGESTEVAGADDGSTAAITVRLPRRLEQDSLHISTQQYGRTRIILDLMRSNCSRRSTQSATASTAWTRLTTGRLLAMRGTNRRPCASSIARRGSMLSSRSSGSIGMTRRGRTGVARRGPPSSCTCRRKRSATAAERRPQREQASPRGRPRGATSSATRRSAVLSRRRPRRGWPAGASWSEPWSMPAAMCSHWGAPAGWRLRSSASHCRPGISTASSPTARVATAWKPITSACGARAAPRTWTTCSSSAARTTSPSTKAACASRGPSIGRSRAHSTQARGSTSIRRKERFSARTKSCPPERRPSRSPRSSISPTPAWAPASRTS